MMYPLITLADNTEFVHSKMKPNGRVKVYVEKPDEKDCFHNASCWIPGYNWEEVKGFSQDELNAYQAVIESLSHPMSFGT